MSKIETVKIVSGDDFVIINNTTFDPEQHELFEGDANAPDTGNSNDPVEIPEGWEDLHWATLVKIAKDITGKIIEKEGDKTPADFANEIIADEVAKRAGAVE